MDERLARLNARALPDWYDEAKFGIFIHWGLWSIPGFAPTGRSLAEVFRADFDRVAAMLPYSEWYPNAIKVPGTPSADHHRDVHGGAPYEDFKAPFLVGLKDWDPAAWAEAFRDAGARYVVLVSKHHDGFCLWPSGVRNPRQDDWTSGRDLVGELAAAVRGAGLRFGLYYSGGLDWTFNRRPLRTMVDVMASTPGGPYPRYADAQVRELIGRYQPSVLWNDISWPEGQDRLNALFEDYYAEVPEGVVNDRWTTPTPTSLMLKFKPLRDAASRRLKARVARSSGEGQGIIPPPVPHSDFRTPEFARFPDIQVKKWEATRGMSLGFGFNREDTDADYTPFETLLADFIDGVAKNGNLLLNVGPEASGAIPAPQAERLKAFGAWLRANDEAIYGTRPWTRAEAVTTDGLPVRFTCRGTDLYVIALGRPAGPRLTLPGVTLAGAATRLSDGAPVTLHQDGPDLTLEQPDAAAGFAPAFRIAGGFRPD